MKYLLDTNVIISLYRHEKNGIQQRLREVGIDNCCISDITLYELYWGARLNRNTKQELMKIDSLSRNITIVPTKNIVKEASRQKYLLKEKGLPIEDFDILIGSAAIVNNLILVTRNTKHMGRLDNIKIEDWS